MKIILTLNNYKYLTGSELWVHTLASELVKRKDEVTILANQIGGEIVAKTPSEVAIFPFFDHPEIEPDLVINSQPQPTSYALKTFPNAYHMQVLHSLFVFEEPVLDVQIMKYIAVRPEIKKHWIDKYPEIDMKTALIWNGVNTTRFNMNGVKPPKHFIRLFVGTTDQLRHYALLDLLEEATENPNMTLWLVL